MLEFFISFWDCRAYSDACALSYIECWFMTLSGMSSELARLALLNKLVRSFNISNCGIFSFEFISRSRAPTTSLVID